MEIKYTNSIFVEDYNMIRALAGWQTVHPEQARVGLICSMTTARGRDETK